MSSFGAFRPVNPQCGDGLDPNIAGQNWDGQNKFNDYVRDALGAGKAATTTAVWSAAAWTAAAPYGTVAATLSGRSITIRIPYDQNKQDLNIDSSDTIHVFRGADNNFYATWPHMWTDDKIGKQKMWNTSKGSVPKGWQVADGTNSTNDFEQGRFIKCHETTSGTKAAATLALSGSNTDYALAGLTPGGNTEYATTGLAAHSDHTHDVSGFCQVEEDLDSGGDAFGGWVSSSLGYYPSTQATITSGGASAALAHSALEPNSGSGHRHAVTNITLTEPNAGQGHRHAVTGLSVSGDPISVTGFVIERVMNT